MFNYQITNNNHEVLVLMEDDNVEFWVGEFRIATLRSDGVLEIAQQDPDFNHPFKLNARDKQIAVEYVTE